MLLCLSQPLTAKNITCGPNSGCLGQLRIGQTAEEIQAILGHPLDLQFLGDGRSGLSVEEPADLTMLALEKAIGVAVKEVDISFTTRKDIDYVDMIYAGIQCKDLKKIRLRFAPADISVQLDGKGGWQTTDPRYPFVWGTKNIPGECSFWLRYSKGNPQ